MTVCLNYFLFYSLINTLFQGPICRHPLKSGSEYHISYNLEEAARIFQLIKDKIDWSTIAVSPVENPNDPDRIKLDMVHRDEIYARRLQAELNRGNETGQRQTAQAAGINPVALIVERNPIAPTVSVTRHQGQMKNCGHSCDLVSTRRCCTCSGKINTIKDFLLYSFVSRSATTSSEW